MTNDAAKRFRSLARYLKKAVPTEMPMQIHLKHLGPRVGCLGRCWLWEDHFIIQVDKKLDYSCAKGVLIHEVAHALCWDMESDNSDHGGFFTEAQKFVFGQYVKWLGNIKS